MSGPRIRLGRTQVPVPAAVRPLLQRVGHLAEGQGMPAYAVGGCVRDWLLGWDRTPDVDVVVEGDGIRLAHLLAQALGATLSVHEQFGTATLNVQDGSDVVHLQRIDVASCRRETYAKPAAYPRVTPGTLQDDLFRRDFTINAMAMAVSPVACGRLVDPFGGAADLRRRRLRALHARSFLDDPSRLLRGIRFLTRFGLRWTPHTRRWVRQAMAAGALGWLNTGRLRKELDRMGQEPDPRACVEALIALLVDSPSNRSAANQLR